MFRYAILIVSIFLPFLTSNSAVAAPAVVVTIQPLHALASGIMGEVASPKLLIKGGHSPHSYSLRPSDAKALADADLVVWVGPELESFLIKPLANLADEAKQLPLLKQSELIRLPQRSGGTWSDSDHQVQHTGHQHDAMEQHGASFNPHLWLDPRNAMSIARLLADALAELDPENQAIYQSNLLDLLKRLQLLDQDLESQLKPVYQFPYLVFHDAYPYFEQRYNLQPLGAISINPERRTGAKRIAEIREQIKSSRARCVFAEPQFKPQLIETLISGTQARSGILDPLGADLPPGTDSYFLLLKRMAENLQQCLLEQTHFPD